MRSLGLACLHWPQGHGGEARRHHHQTRHMKVKERSTLGACHPTRNWLVGSAETTLTFLSQWKSALLGDCLWAPAKILVCFNYTRPVLDTSTSQIIRCMQITQATCQKADNDSGFYSRAQEFTFFMSSLRAAPTAVDPAIRLWETL